MKHHFGDHLDRQEDYWTIVPNRERYSYQIKDVCSGDKNITIATIGSGDEGWEKIFAFPNLVELTLHEPSTEQMKAIGKLLCVKRLRITHARPKNIEFLGTLINVEELVLEYVSGFSDLSPLRMLHKLRSLHIENLRRVSDFSGLAGISSLRYLKIDGTLDWKQPIASFEFLSGLLNLEVLKFGQVINKSPYPALLPATRLRNLKKIVIVGSMFPTNEYALLEVGLPGVKGAVWEPYRRFAYSRMPIPQIDIRSSLPVETIEANHPDVFIAYDGKRLINDPDTEWFEFLGKGAGSVKYTHPSATQKCKEFAEKYSKMKQEARDMLSQP